MDKTTLERLERLGEVKNPWERVSASVQSVLGLQTTESNTQNGTVSYWPNGIPTTNLPELEIAGKKVSVFYQNPQAGYVRKVGISLNDGKSTIELTDFFEAGNWYLSADGQQVTPDPNVVNELSDLLDSYRSGLLRTFGNNYIEAYTVTEPIPHTA